MIVTISRQPGCFGEEIAEKLAKKWSYAYFDSIALREKLFQKKVPEILINSYDEKKPGYWSIFSEKKERYLNNLKMVILDFAGKGDCVLVGRGTQVLFTGIPGVVRVRIIAPEPVRIKQFSKEQGCTEREAGKIINHINNERKGFYRSFFNVDLESDELYDLIINNRYLDIDGTVRVISSLIEVKREMDCSIDDLILKQKVIEEILYKSKIPVHSLSVNVIEGAVNLIGSVRIKENVDLCRSVILNIPGVTGVNTKEVRVPEINTYGR